MGESVRATALEGLMLEYSAQLRDERTLLDMIDPIDAGDQLGERGVRSKGEEGAKGDPRRIAQGGVGRGTTTISQRPSNLLAEEFKSVLLVIPVLV